MMRRLLRQLSLLLDGDASASASAIDCHHGVWNAAAETCHCDAGWSTDLTSQDILGGHIVFCNSQASTPAPGNTTAATTTSAASRRTLWIIVCLVVAAVVAATALIIFCCCCRRTKRAAAARAKAQQQQQQQEQQEEQRHREAVMAEMQQAQWMRQMDEEAEWNREAMRSRERWNTRSPLQQREESAAVVHYGVSGHTSTTMTTDPHLLRYEELMTSQSLGASSKRPTKEYPTTAELDGDLYYTAPWPQPRAVRYAAPAELYGSSSIDNSQGLAVMSDECIYTDYSDSPPPLLHPPHGWRGGNSAANVRRAEPLDHNDPF